MTLRVDLVLEDHLHPIKSYWTMCELESCPEEHVTSNP